MERAYDLVKRGYAYVVQNERGRYFSEGEWDILGVPLTDGYDAFTWLKNQAWSNGKIGTLGCSSTAEWQMAVAALDHPAHAAMVAQGFGAGVGRVGDIYEQGNWYRGGAQQMLFTAWLYGVEQDKFKPRIPPGATQEDLIRISRYYDLSPENPAVDMSVALKHLPVADILKNVNGKVEIYDKMIRRKPNDPEWYKGGLYHDNMPFGVPSFWFCSWYDVSITPNLALFNHVRKNAEDPAVAENQYLVIAPTLHCAYTRATEQTIVGERNALTLEITEDDQPVTNAEATLDVEVLYAGRTWRVNMNPTTTPGLYTATLFPTVRGVYTTRLFGTLGSTDVDVELDPEEVMPASNLQFPQPLPDTIALQEQVEQLQADLQTARTWAFVGSGAGLAGIALGLVGLLRRKSS